MLKRRHIHAVLLVLLAFLGAAQDSKPRPRSQNRDAS